MTAASRTRRIAETATTADAAARAQADLAACTARTRTRMREQDAAHAAEFPDSVASDPDHPAALFDLAVVPLHTVADRLLRLAAEACANEEVGKLRTARAIVRVHNIRVDMGPALIDYCHGGRAESEAVLTGVRLQLRQEAAAYLRQPGQHTSLTDIAAHDLLRYLDDLPKRLLPAIPRRHARRIARDNAAVAYHHLTRSCPSSSSDNEVPAR